MEDQAIIRRVQAGDSEAYALLVQNHHRALLSFIHRLVRDAHLAEDIGQEVFLDAYKALGRFDAEQGTPFMAWLYILARNRSVSVLRSRGRLRPASLQDALELPGQEPGTEAGLIDLEERLALAVSLEKLEEPFKSTILMSLEGEPLETIAQCFGVPTATVKTRLFRAKEKLRRNVTAYFGGVCHERQV